VGSLPPYLDILRVLAKGRRRMTTTEIGRELNISPSTVRYNIMKLERDGYVARDGKWYYITDKGMELLRNVARELMEVVGNG